MHYDTTDLTQLRSNWDCVVVGAGPAGALAAHQIAGAGFRVLLIDKSKFPRSKVCGSCINGSAQNALTEAGLGALLTENGAIELEQLQLVQRGKSASIRLPAGASLSRAAFDLAIIEHATARGAHFLQETAGTVLFEPGDEADRQLAHRSIKLQTHDQTLIVDAKIVIVADGLAGRSLEMSADFRSQLTENSRFGAGVILDEAPEFYQPGSVYMAIGESGYLGLVRLEDGRIDIAAAFDSEPSREAHGPAQVAVQLLEECELPVPTQLAQARWSGTQALSRKRAQIAGTRLLVVGDACGYPEPFTGEGIAWALWSSLSASKLAIAGIRQWRTEIIARWNKIHRRLQRQHMRSAFIATLLRERAVRSVLINTLSAWPSLTSPVVQSISCATNPLDLEKS